MLNNNEVTNSNEDKLLGILLDNKLNFDKFSLQKSRPNNKCPSQVKELPYIRSKKLNTEFCYKVSVYLLPFDMDVYVKLSNALKIFHERALQLIYNKHERSFNTILTENNLKDMKKTLNFLPLKFTNLKMACLCQS